MSKWAIIENNLVVNTIEADADFVNEHYPNAILVDGISADINYTYENGKFIEPAPNIVEEPVSE